MRHGCLRSDITTYRIVFVLQHGQGHSAPQPLETRRISRTLFTDEKGNKCNWKRSNVLKSHRQTPPLHPFNSSCTLIQTQMNWSVRSRVRLHTECVCVYAASARLPFPALSAANAILHFFLRTNITSERERIEMMFVYSVSVTYGLMCWASWEQIITDKPINTWKNHHLHHQRVSRDRSHCSIITDVLGTLLR